MRVTGRFAPSPSGRMHLGNVFSALLAWLSVRHEEGTMVLRIEDLDPERCKPIFADQLRRDLEWLGLDWDVEQTPQSARAQAYQAELEKLADAGRIYPCYCSREQLRAASAPHASDGQWIYPGTCRNLSLQERAAMKKAPCWRVAVPDETISFVDGLQGFYEENLAKDCGDFIVRRADGVFAYQLAVVTDDAQAQVTQVVRGRDLLSSTARQIWLQRMLGFPEPEYCHVPLLVAPDGRRLSKRERDLDMQALRERFSPEELIGLLGYLAGILPEKSAISPRELCPVFSWENVKKENVLADPMLFAE